MIDESSMYVVRGLATVCFIGYSAFCSLHFVSCTLPLTGCPHHHHTVPRTSWVPGLVCSNLAWTAAGGGIAGDAAEYKRLAENAPEIERAMRELHNPLPPIFCGRPTPLGNLTESSQREASVMSSWPLSNVMVGPAIYRAAGRASA